MKINKFISKNKNNVFYIEAKKIKAMEKDNIHTHTILDIFAKACGFSHSAHIDTCFENNELNDFVFLNIWELEDCEKSIIKELKKVNIHSVQHIDFIRNEINKRKNNIIEYDAFNLFELFSVVHLLRKGSRLINEDWSLNEDSLKSFLYWYTSEIDSEIYLPKQHSDKLEYINSRPPVNNGTSYFNIYKTYLENTLGKCPDHEYNLPFENIIQRGFYFATTINNGIQQKRSEGLLFEIVFQFKNKEINIEEVCSRISDILEQEKKFHFKKNVSYHEDNSHYEKEISSLRITPPKLLKSNYKCVDIPSAGFYKLNIGFYDDFQKNIIGLKRRNIKEYESISYKENILTIGSNYTSVGQSDLTLLAQEIYMSNSIIYLNNRNEPSFINMINNAAKINNRINDVLHLSLDNAEEFLKPEKIVSLLNSSKIILINLPDLEKVNNDLKERINNLHMTLFKTIMNEKNKISDNNSLYINHLNHLSTESLLLLKDLLNQEDNDKFHCRLSCFDLTWRKEHKPILSEMLKENITYCKIMKCYDPTETIEYFNVSGKDIGFRVFSIDLREMDYNEFFLAKNLSIYPKLFKSFSYHHDNILNDFTNQPIYE